MNPPQLTQTCAFSHRSGWLTFLAAAGCCVALAAIVPTLIVARDMLRQHRDQRWDIELQVLWQLEAEWNSEPMIETRARAAGALLEQRDDAAVEHVLRFLDQVAYLSKQVSLDYELLWYRFYWPAACYWHASDFLRRQQRGVAGRRYRYLPVLVDALQAEEKKRTQNHAEPTSEEVRDYLLAEARAGACEEETSEDSLQMTPL